MQIFEGARVSEKDLRSQNVVSVVRAHHKQRDRTHMVTGSTPTHVILQRVDPVRSDVRICGSLLLNGRDVDLVLTGNRAGGVVSPSMVRLSLLVSLLAISLET